MLKQRVITALLLLPAVYFLIFSLRLEIFAAVILVIVYLMALEWAKLAGFVKPTHSSYYALLVSATNLSIWKFSERVEVWPSISWPNYFHLDLPLAILLISLVAIFAAVMIVLTFSINSQWWQSTLSKSVLGIILLPTFFISFVSIRNIGYSAGNTIYGGTLLFYMLLLFWA
ncbi:MAG: hypothetical protein L3J46_11435, partial [Kangiellaceae bacterium]|nr:hypothetical protein [Kangiellaceae bacterium]